MTTALLSLKRRTSLSHWYLTEAGHTTSAPLTPRRSARRQAAPMAWAVFPRPMSSARIVRSRSAAKRTPRFWKE